MRQLCGSRRKSGTFLSTIDFIRICSTATSEVSEVSDPEAKTSEAIDNMIETIAEMYSSKTPQVHVNSKRKKRMQELAEELNHFFQYHNITVYSLYYDGSLSRLDLNALKDIQIQDR